MQRKGNEDVAPPGNIADNSLSPFAFPAPNTCTLKSVLPCVPASLRFNQMEKQERRIHVSAKCPKIGITHPCLCLQSLLKLPSSRVPLGHLSRVSDAVITPASVNRKSRFKHRTQQRFLLTGATTPFGFGSWTILSASRARRDRHSSEARMSGTSAVQTPRASHRFSARSS